MRRMIWIASLVVAGILAGLYFFQPPSSPADPATPAPPAAPTPPARQALAPLPISQVILFSSGVGYFQREGDVEGSTRIDLSFPVNDINDLLKSLVLQDLGGGHISAVSYDSHDPIDKTLKGFAINLSTNPTFGQILDQARGEKVEVVLQASTTTQAGTLNGTVIGIEHQKKPAGKDAPVEVDILNLWCSDGFHSVALADVQRLHFLNPIMDNEFKRALDVLALSHDTQKKSVSLSFTGEGKRPVRVGYVVENPIWKTSYRLVLNKEDKPLLQGWAVVENPSDEDWSNVRMALVSGRPISFRMDLYQPLYVPRPVVEPELFASLRPPTYSGAMEGKPGLAAAAPPPPGPSGDARRGGLMRKADEKASRELLEDRNGDDLSLGMRAPMNLKQSVASAATATEMGDFFEYVIDNPVSLPRQKSALLPIVSKEVEATRLSIYNPNVHPKFPLLGLRFRNSTGLHLMQGPITVFDNSSYAGDARLPDVQPKEDRLLSYAIDLGTEVEPVAKRDPDRLTTVKIVKGVLYTTSKVRETRTYNIKNRSEHDRTVLLEHPFRADFQLVSKDQPTERAREVYRFEIPVPAGKTASQEIVEEQDQVQTTSLNNADDQSIRILVQGSVASPKVKAALGQAVALKSKLAETRRDRALLEKQLQEITQDQTRLRANLKEMPPTAEAYKRYLKKFDDQETEIEKLQAQIKVLQNTENQQVREYDAFLTELTVE